MKCRLFISNMDHVTNIKSRWHAFAAVLLAASVSGLLLEYRVHILFQLTILQEQRMHLAYFPRYSNRNWD